MRRRTVLGTAAAATAALAGCGSPRLAVPTATEDPPGLEAAVDVPVDVTLSADASLDGGHDLSISLRHTATPRCRWADPPCAAPERLETVLERETTLYPGDSVQFAETLRLTPDVDTVRLRARAGDGETVTLDGVEAGAGEVLGDAVSDYDFQVGHTLGLTVRVGPGGDLTLGVGN